MLERSKHLNNTHSYVRTADGNYCTHTGLDITILFPSYKASVRWFKTVAIVEGCSLVLCANAAKKTNISC